MNTSTQALRETSARYHPVAVVLHWVLGAALVAVFVLGIYMHELPFSPRRLTLYSWHKWAGLVLLVLAFVRLFWRWRHRPPALPLALVAATPRWQQVAHHATHRGLYVLFFVVPLLGWAYSSAAGFSVVWFGVWPLPDWVPVSEPLAAWLKQAHQAAALGLGALVVLHAGAALKHQWWDRDGLLGRMSVFRQHGEM